MPLTQDDINTAVIVIEQNMKQLLEKIDSIKSTLNQGKYVEEKYWKMAHESINKSLEIIEEKLMAVPVESRIAALEAAQKEQKRAQDANKASMRKIVVSIVTAVLVAILAAFWAFLQQ